MAAAEASMSAIVYVIRHLATKREYVGTTVHHERRWREHLMHVDPNSHIQRSIRKYGRDSFSFEVLSEHDDQLAARAAEIETIRSRGSRWPNGFNHTDGGDGLCNPTDDVRKRIGAASLGRKASKETRAKLSEAVKRRLKENPEFIQRARLARTGMKDSDATCEKRRVAMLGRKHTSEAKAKMSASHKASPHKMTSEHRAKVIESLRRRVWTSEMREKISAKLRGRAVSEETKVKLRSAFIGKPISPETRAKISSAHRGKRLSIETKTKISNAMMGHSTSQKTREKIAATLRKRSRVVGAKQMSLFDM
jgi:group I intron endonuclease